MSRLRSQIWHTILSLLLLALTGVLIAWAYMQYQNPDSLPIRQVKVEGEIRHLKNAEIEQAIAPLVTTGFFTLRVNRIRQTLLAMPWVKEVTVRRIWPDTLVLKVEEQKPVARWGKDALVNEESKLFFPNSGSIPTNLPLLFGPEEQVDVVLNQFESMNEALKPLQVQLTRLTLSERRAWDGELDNEIVLRFGRDAVDERLQRFLVLYPQIVGHQALQNISYMDLRYTNGIAVGVGPENNENF